MSDDETRVIPMTDRRPVKIRAAEWPVIAESEGDSWSGSDYGRYQQALAQGELDTYYLIVRQHEDGRTIVYGGLDAATAWTGSETRRAGELLDRPEPLEHCRMPYSVIDQCIADLPAEEL